MRRSADKILTTHTGSLPRPAKVVELLLAEREKPGARRAEFDAAVDDAIAGVVRKQVEAGLDIINDGEQGRTDYTVHVLDRLTGYEGDPTPPRGTGEPEFPELAQLLKQFASPFQHRPTCSGPVAWKDWPAVEADIARAKAATAKAGAQESFMTSRSCTHAGDIGVSVAHAPHCLQQFSMRLSCGRGDGGESGMQQSALNQLAAAKSGFARTPEWDSWRSCLRSIRCSDHCEGAWTGSRTSAAA